MIPLELSTNSRSPLTILCLGAHSDDLEIGACATLLALAGPGSRIVWVVFCAEGARREEALASARHCTRDYREAIIETHTFRDGFFPAEAVGIKEKFEALKAHQPDVVFTHSRSDLHQDHRLIADMTWQTFRRHLILEYEIPKYDGDFGCPNMFFPVSEDLRRQKLHVLEHYFGSQRGKHWFTPDLFTAVLRLRGMECNSDSGFAEAFYCRKAVLAM